MFKSKKYLSNLVRLLISNLIGLIGNSFLTFVFIDSFIIMMVIVTGTSFEFLINKFISLSLGINNSSFTLDKNDIIRLIEIWFILIPLFWQVITRVIKIQIKFKTLYILPIILLGHIYLGYKIKSLLVAFTFFALTLGSLLIYNFLSLIANKFRVISFKSY
ncbi:hypothetical protein COX08_04760 [Candidatus Beckwithbacteria bacterium CG23_combo_of_CG06-09_8_20_14_all_34_8]|uniref:Uncharacterized protein n=1 Tax=Candidatus Beckwithbacteria bacterium CG23_combo_of_CG06-09_8_20_14_all_34_8 TaxID=1974497 RepID=A0A2H0B512_9BACT|nr:MAG: hypothetical protein COX08_04760 [Candidatus Beckwithbacteria bacterium CG23_combo_of_CG06-09_8_20_14_all_34_8]